MDHCDGSFHLTTCGELFQAETGLTGSSSRQPKRNNEPQKIPIKLNTTCTKVNLVIPKIIREHGHNRSASIRFLV